MMDEAITGAAAELHRRLEGIERQIDIARAEKKEFLGEWNDDMKELDKQREAVLSELNKISDDRSDILPMFEPPESMEEGDEDDA